jgi:hypothetical protein
MIEFKAWDKIPRLNRDITITEKIDGTNAAVGIAEFPFGWHAGGTDDDGVNHDRPDNAWLCFRSGDDDGTGLPNFEYLVYAQSRNRIITPGQDNHGFAAWVWGNAEALISTLGAGLHYGEWWGSGIQRGYGLPKGEKRFSLFNTKRWAATPLDEWGHSLDFSAIPGLGVVPVLYEGPFEKPMGVGAYTWAMRPWEAALDKLEIHGSQAAPGFDRPEGIVIYHKAANTMFKVTLENDEAPKAANKRSAGLAA